MRTALLYRLEVRREGDKSSFIIEYNKSLREIVLSILEGFKKLEPSIGLNEELIGLGESLEGKVKISYSKGGEKRE